MQPIFQSYTTEDGLGGEGINEVLVDRYGYVWTAAFSGLHRYDGYDFLEYPADPLDSCALNNRTVLCLLEDEEGFLWVGTRGGLHRLDRSTGCFSRYFYVPEIPSSLPGNEIVDILLDAQGRVVVQTTSGTAHYQPETDDFARLPATPIPWQRLISHQGRLLAAGPAGLADPARPQETLIAFDGPAPTSVQVLKAHGDSLLLGTNSGIYCWDGQDSLIRNPYGPNSRSILDLLPMNIHGLDWYWAASRSGGLGFFDLQTGIGGAYESDNQRAFSLLDNHVRSLAYDKLGNLWIGTWVGLNRYNVKFDDIIYYRNNESDGLGDQTMEVHVDPSGAVFLYERWQGLYRSERLNQKMTLLDFPENAFREGKNLDFMMTDRSGTTWLLRSKDGIYRYDPAVGKPVLTFTDPELNSRSVNEMHQDAHDDDVFWLATSNGLGRLHLPTGKLEWWQPSRDHATLPGDAVATILPTPDGRVWLSAGNRQNDPLGYFDLKEQSFHFFTYQPGDLTRIGGGRIKQLARSNDGTIWAAASQGLIAVDPVTNTPRLITRVGANNIGTVESMLTDSLGGVWFTRDDQIGHYQSTTDRLDFITCSPIRQFSNGVASHHPSGRMLFGGLGGLVSINPYGQSGTKTSFPALVLNEIRVNGAAYRTDRPIPEIDHLELNAQQRAFSLRFSSLLFEQRDHLEYAYRLDDGPWLGLGTERSLSFADLLPGAFNLALRSTDGQGNWNPEPRLLRVSVAPFWYETTVARLALATFLLLLLGLLARMLFRRRLERQALVQMRELDAFKSRFLTNLTHEFRTPLTLILGPARRLLERSDPTVSREARRIDQQGRKLLGLINQLLDLRQLEAGELSVLQEPVVLPRFFGEITGSFREAAADKGLSLRFRAEQEGAVAGAVEVDKSKVESIVTNLLANALKFTPVGGTVEVLLWEKPKKWGLSVADSGPGIPASERELIFERFARSGTTDASGTGIGLALARELARLLGGKLLVGESSLGGADFRLSMSRISAAEPMSKSTAPPVLTTVRETLPSPETTSARVLIVEDDPEVRNFLTESLSEHYAVSSAPDGETGLAIALKEIPDLVVSDVMMPGLNGLQLCARLKNDRRTSHLPILLLTARTANEHRLSGLERGADAYLTKPFSERELHLRIRNLLTLRDETARRLREQILNDSTPVIEPSSAPESEFLTDLRRLIISRLDDPNLSVGDLERGLGLSRSQLHRKLTAILGLSANKLINQLRLEQAAVRLRTTDQPISQIAYDCGFSDGGYFGKKFKAQYGVTPGEWRVRD